MNKNQYSIGKSYINITNPEHTRQEILKAVTDGVNGYICVSNLRTVAIADKNEEYRQVMRHSYMNIPDGMPLVWCGKLWGLKDAQRSSGPDLFLRLMEEDNPKLKFFLLGDTDDTLFKVKKRFPKASIVGLYSPPFKPLEEYDFKGIAKMLDVSGANIVWTSLRAPKQDILSAKLIEYTHSKLFIGVGAAFRFSLGEYRLPPEWVRRCGLAGFWMFRNTDIWDEFCWYIKHSIFLLGKMISLLYKKWRGKKYYE